MDTVSKEVRSRIMSAVRSKDTKPEMVVRRMLHGMGYRYRLHAKDLPGKPDIVLPKYRTVVEVRSCFFHRHPGCRHSTTPDSNRDFWKKKLRDNVSRDKRNEERLRDLGWKVVVVWECETKLPQGLRDRMTREISR